MPRRQLAGVEGLGQHGILSDRHHRHVERTGQKFGRGQIEATAHVHAPKHQGATWSGIGNLGFLNDTRCAGYGHTMALATGQKDVGGLDGETIKFGVSRRTIDNDHVMRLPGQDMTQGQRTFASGQRRPSRQDVEAVTDAMRCRRLLTDQGGGQCLAGDVGPKGKTSGTLWVEIDNQHGLAGADEVRGQ